MGARKLTRWQKASALVPMAVLVGAWGAALTNSGLATASGGISASDIPDVPTTAFEQPASVQPTPAGIDAHAGLAGAVATLSTNGIPSAALYAYQRAETLLGEADASCQLPWNLVAAIGRVESNHGRTNGNSLSADGLATPGLYGALLDGNDGRAKVGDTDNGTLDKNSVYDRAVGPMQFVPSTWRSVGIDSDNDGKKNPQDIDDAATAAGIYLCAGEGDLSTHDGAAVAVQRYNHSASYVDLVLEISAKYADGDFTQSPNGRSTAAVLTAGSHDQTLTPAQREKSKKAEQKAADQPSTSTGGNDDTSTGGDTGGTGGTPGDTGTVPDSSGNTGSTGGSTGGTLGSGLQDGLAGTPLAPITKPVTDLLSKTEASLRCLIQYPLGLPKDKFDKCVYDLTH